MYIPQTVLALWGSQLVLRASHGWIADSGSRGIPAEIPGENLRKTIVVAQQT